MRKENEENERYGTAPRFIFSPYFVDEEDNWHLKEGAPEDIKKEFEEWMRARQEAEKRGKILY